jgi:hypothetical protein
VRLGKELTGQTKPEPAPKQVTGEAKPEASPKQD